ncbi:MAG: type II secretion system GspH family protein [Acidobacteriia bacterium]|nr:type II secretion system GspH family protein [Terriglobia bacterium]
MKHSVGGINARAGGRSGARRGLRRRHANHGFTMLEMVIVASLILTVVSVAFPRLIQMRENFNLQGDIRVVQTTIQTARYNAIAHGRQYKIIFKNNVPTADPIPQMQIQRDEAVDPQNPTHAAVFQNRGGPVVLSRGVTLDKAGELLCDFSGTVNSTGFDLSPQGEPSLTMSNAKTGKNYTVFVSLLGRVRIVQNQ